MITDLRGRKPDAPILRLAVVGVGYWGPHLVRVLSERPDIELRWICDLDAAALSRAARRDTDAGVTNDLQQVLEDPEVDGVLLATPVFTHYELALRCLEAGKHTFVEKPLAPRGDQARHLIDLATELGLVLMCGHTFLYSAPVRAVRRLIEAGELGELFFVSSSRVNLGLHQKDVSVLWDLAPHDFSILLYWLGGTAQSVRATGRDSIVKGIVDVAFVTMEFGSGVIASVELSWLAPSKLRRTVLVGSKKMVVYEDGNAEALRIFDHGVVYEDPESFGEYQLSYRTGDILSPKLASEEPLAIELADFVAAIRGTPLPPEHLEIALDVVRLIEAAEASLAAGGASIDSGELAWARDEDSPVMDRYRSLG